MKNNINTPKRFPFIFLVLLTSIVVIACGYLYYKYEEHVIRKEKYKELKAISALKIEQLTKWRKERLGNVYVLAASPFFVEATEQWLSNKNNAFLLNRIKKRLESFKASFDYENILLSSPSGELFFSLDNTFLKVDFSTKAYINKSVIERKEIFTDFYYCEIHHKIHIDVIIPFINDKGIVFTVLIMRINPYNYLYPLIQSWPTVSKTAETLIVRKDGDYVIFLNELRHRKNTTLSLRIPLSKKEIPAVQAALGYQGIFEGNDYRGVDVLSDIHPIPETSWIMVTKVDKSEIFSELYYRAIFITITCLILMMLSLLLIISIFNRYQRVFLKESKLQLEASIRASNTGLWDWDLKTNKIYFSTEWKKQIGYEESEITDDISEWHNRIHPDDFENVITAIDIFIKQSQKNYEQTYRFKHKDGYYLWILAKGSIINDENNKPIRMLGSHLDITKQKLQEEEIKILNKRLTDLVSAIQGLSLVHNLEDIMSIVKSSARKIVEADGAAFVLRDGDMCYYADEDAIKPLFKGQRFPLDECISGWVIRHKQTVIIPDIFKDSRIRLNLYKPTFVKSLAMVPIKTDDPIGAIGVYWKNYYEISNNNLELIQSLADTTAIAIQNVQLFNELEQRIKERTQQLENSNRELEAFAYSVSHDLRAPLRAIDGFSKFLLDDYEKKLDSEGVRLINIIRTNAQKMDQLIMDLLSLSRVSRIELKPSLIDMSKMANSIYHEVISLENIDNIEFLIDTLPDAYGDPTLIHQVWSNLISNAIKYTSKSKIRKIYIHGYTENDNNIYYVKDTGTGFSKEYAHKLFGVFQRLHSPKEFEGSGIGLAIVKRIINRHNGKVWAEGKVNEGATFYFSLPKTGGE
jgi:hypothetical protein